MPIIYHDEKESAGSPQIEYQDEPTPEFFSPPIVDLTTVPSPGRTDVKGTMGAITRGAGPYVAGGLAGTAFGGPVGGFAGVGAVGLSQFVGDPAVAASNKFLGTNMTKPSVALNNLFDRMGIAKPDTGTERMVQLYSEGLASGPVQGGRSIARQSASGLVSAGLGEEARSAVEGMGGGPKTQFAAALVAGGGSGILTAPGAYAIDSPMAQYNKYGTKTSLSEMSILASMASKGDDFAKRKLASIAATGVDPGTFRAAQEMGVDRYITPGQLTTNKAYRELEETLAGLPDSVADEMRKTGISQMSVLAHNFVENIFGGKADDMSATVSKTKAWMEDLSSGFRKRADENYGILRERVPAKMQNPATIIVSSIENRMRELVPNAPEPTVVKTRSGARWDKHEGYNRLSSIEKSAYDKLRPIPRLDKSGKVYYDYPSYAQIDDVRKEVGRAIDNKMAFPTEDQARLKQLYAELTQDQEAFIKKAGVDQSIWELAKANTRHYKAMEDSLQVLFGKELDKSFQQMVTGGIERLAKGDAESFERVMRQIPRDMRQSVALSGIMSMVNKNAAGGEFGLENFSKWYNALEKQSASRNAIMRNLPQEAQVGLKNIAQVGQVITETGKKHPAYVIGAIDKANSLMNKIYYAGAKASGVVILQNTIADIINSRAASYSLAYNVTGALQGAAKNKALIAANRFIGSPEFHDLVRAMARGDDIPKHVFRLSKTQAAVTYARAAGIPARQKDIENWLLSGLSFMEFDHGPQQEEAPPNASSGAPVTY